MANQTKGKIFANMATAISMAALFGCVSVETTTTPKISAENLKTHVAMLASDAFEGRGAGYRGEAMAAEYIAENFQEIGLARAFTDIDGVNGYLQEFDLHVLDGPVPWEILTSRNVIGVLRERTQMPGM